MRLTSLLLSVIPFLVSVSAGAAVISDDEFRRSFEAAREQKWQDVSSGVSDHVLFPYIQYHQLRAQLPHLKAEDVRSWVKEHQDTPLSAWLEKRALLDYGKAGLWQEIRTLTDRPPGDASARCYFYLAWYDQMHDVAVSGGQNLWLSGSSRPDECDALFVRLRKDGEINDLLVWHRLLLSLQDRNVRMVRYLGKQLHGTVFAPAAEYVSLVINQPQRLLALPEDVAEQTDELRLMYAAMQYLSTTDTVRALEYWPQLSDSYPFSAPQREVIEKNIARYSYRLDPDNDVQQKALHDILLRQADAALIEPQMRTAIAGSDWLQVLYWSAQVKGEDFSDSFNQYWRGRALQATGHQDLADEAFRSAAQSRNFYGFLAADRMSLPFAMGYDIPQVSEEALSELDKTAALQRIDALWGLGELGLALQEWQWLMSHNPDETAALAEYALRKHWFSLAVAATIKGGHWDYIAHRFPLAYRNEFAERGAALGLDPRLLMSIARRESAFNPEAVSPVGARGLMQVMPDTARHLSRRLSIPYPGTEGLADAGTNIRLASQYVKELSDRYHGNLIAVLAGYNAGPSRADVWLRDNQGDFDQLIESISFRETRDYVKAVLAYRVIFDSLSGEDQLSVLSPAERFIPENIARN
ncbi:MAG TPA: lytic murein transglycosylase [Oceanospirillales bacterium]|nr:lytic murein transglycosylase [Oceanospirillaceae bacterium]HBS41109.1 lytic murein transglycosylase [Oceanospirillales bacterium]|tara:strand:- start:35756 stop:37675 length:1920 start_codon:yes stop_codon:yes gene_type:complete